MDELIVAKAKSAFLSNPPKFRKNGGIEDRLILGEFDGVVRLAAATLKDENSSVRQRVEARLALAAVSRHQGDLEAARDHRLAAHALADPQGPDQVRILLATAHELMPGTGRDGNPHDAATLFEKAERMASELGEERARLASVQGRVDALTRIGRSEEAFLVVDAAMLRVLELRYFVTIPGLLAIRGIALSNLDNSEAAAGTLEAAILLARYGGFAEWEMRARYGLGAMLTSNGEPGDWELLDEALAMLSAAEKIALRLRSWSVLASIRSAMSRACERLGNLSRAAVYREAELEAAANFGRVLEPPALKPSEKAGEEKLVVNALRSAQDALSEPCVVFHRALDDDELRIVHRNRSARALGPAFESAHTLSELETEALLVGFGGALRAASMGTAGEDEIDAPPSYGHPRIRRIAVPSDSGAVLVLREGSQPVAEASPPPPPSEFLERLNHDIRTPLNGVMGLANLLERSDLDARQRIWIEGLLASGDMLNRVIGDLLDISKLDDGNLELLDEPFSVATVVREAAGLSEPSAREKGLALWVDVDPALGGTVKGDPSRLRQVLNHLLGNAVRYTEDGEVRISARSTGHGARFEITDTGVGISSERQRLLFGELSKNGAREGDAGLGISLSRRLVELMGGRLNVRSREGEGSVFSFEIPFASSGVGAGTGADADDLDLKVLLVEDNDVSALVAAGHLERVGCRVTRAKDGEEALRLIQAGGTYDVILMDIRLPGMSGVQTAQQLRRLAGQEHVPIVALTAGALRDEREACFEAGMDAFLSKPFRPRDLTETLRRLSRN